MMHTRYKTKPPCMEENARAALPGRSSHKARMLLMPCIAAILIRYYDIAVGE